MSMKELTIDIETFPTEDQKFIDQVTAEVMQSVEAEIEAVKPPSNYKDAVKIEEWLATTGAEKVNALRASADSEITNRIKATGLDGCLGTIAVIGYAIEDEAPKALFFDGTTPAVHERALLEEFFELMESRWTVRDVTRVIGFNHIGFDLRFMFQRAVILGVKPPSWMPFNVKPWDDRVFDVMVQWCGVGNRAKLDKIARAVGLPGKQGIDGSKVADHIRAGKIAEVADYCCDDVEQTRSIYKRMTFAEQLLAA